MVAMRGSDWAQTGRGRHSRTLGIMWQSSCTPSHATSITRGVWGDTTTYPHLTPLGEVVTDAVGTPGVNWGLSLDPEGGPDRHEIPV